MKTTILASRHNYNEAIDEERSNWVSYILDCLELDSEAISDMPKDKAFDELVNNGIDIIDYPDLGAVKIMFGYDVVAEWGEPEFLMLKDEGDKEFYYQITIENWSIFDDENDDENDDES